MTQIELHKKIKSFLSKKVNSVTKEDLLKLLVNKDTKIFFFSEANEKWLYWLWKNGFLDNLGERLEDRQEREIRFISELNYLTRMADKNPEDVISIISSISIEEGNFDPEVIERFLHILENDNLSYTQINSLIKKICDEKWVYYLIHNYEKTGYAFKKIVKNINKFHEGKALINLFKAMSIIKEDNDKYLHDYFCIKDLSASDIFEALVNIKESYLEEALKSLIDVLSDIIKLHKKDGSVFDYNDRYILSDVDFFEIEKDTNSFYQKDLKKLIVAIKMIIGRIVLKSDNENVAYNYIDDLPFSRLSWRLRLSILSQRSDIFNEKLKLMLFKLFEVEDYYQIEGGTEYKKALKACFGSFTKEEQRDYIDKIFNYFSDKSKKYSDQPWHKITAWEILSSIYNYLEDIDKDKCMKFFGKECSSEYVPENIIIKSEGGTVSNKSPVSLDDYSIEKIIDNLKTEWDPKVLSQKFKNDYFLTPRNAEGLGDELRKDVKKRKVEYLKHINGFFDRRYIHSHYLYSFLRGLEDVFKDGNNFTFKEIEQIINLFICIKKSGIDSNFERGDKNSFLSDWIQVHVIICELLLYILRNEKYTKKSFNHRRNDIKDLILYLFSVDDPATEKEKDERYGDFHVIAINSVKGRAFEAFVVFVENDGSKLLEDVKEIYKKIVINEKLLSVRFMIGRYLAFFYFRDIEFVKKILPLIFPRNESEIYLATWEGYISNILYDRLFNALSDYYSYAISFDRKKYLQREHSKEINKALANHLALAFDHLGLDKEDPLFIEFWSFDDDEAKEEFISFIGRSCLSRDNVSEEWLKENKVDKEKLINFWDWALENIIHPKILSGFGFWINMNKEVLDDNVVIDRMARTLKKSNGCISWESGLLTRIIVFAKKDKERTFEIIKNFLLASDNELTENSKSHLLYTQQIKEALSIVYKNGNEGLKQEVVNLIDVLIEKGSIDFWWMKEIL